MPRTFSLARLMLGITLICIACGCAVSFPDPAFWLVFAALISPGMAIASLAAGLSKHGSLLIFNAFVGAVCGFIAMPMLGPSPASCCFDSSVDTPLIFPALGALLFGGIFVLAEKLDTRSALANPKSQIPNLKSKM